MVSMGFPSSAFNLRRLVCISATVNEHLSSSSSSASSKSTLKKNNSTICQLNPSCTHTPLWCSLLMLNYSFPRMQFKDLLLPVLPFTLGRISGQSHVIVGIFVWPACLINQLVYQKTSLSLGHGCAQAGRQAVYPQINQQEGNKMVL